MKRLLATVSIVAFVGACASAQAPVPVREAPAPINGAMSTGATLPIITNLPQAPRNERGGGAGTKRPTKGEMRGGTWVPEFNPDSVFIVPIQTTDATGSRPVEHVIVTSDLPSGQGVCSISGVEAAQLGSAYAISFKAGAPVGTQVPCTLQFGGMNVKLILEATGRRGISELRIEGRKKKQGEAFPQGVCSHANYRVSTLVPGGPIGACTIVDATGANTATYIKLPGNTQHTPVVRSSDGKQLRLANFDTKRLPSGEYLLRVQGSPDSLELMYQTGEKVLITRGAY